MTTTTAPPVRATARWLLPTLALSQFISALDYNIVFVALPQIGAELGFTAYTLQWVVGAYAVAFGGSLLLGGRLTDVFGARRVLLGGLALFGLASAVGAVATGAGLLVAARAGQGIGAAMAFPAVLATIGTAFEDGAPRYRALAAWSAAGGIGLAAGALLGGVLTSWFGWQAVFVVNVPLVAVALAGVLASVPRTAGGSGTAGAGRSLDLPGAVLATAGTSAVVYALVAGPEAGWGSTATLTAVLGGLALLAAFVAVERRSAEPLMPLGLLRHRSLTASMGVTFLFMAAFGTTYYLYTLHLQDGLGLDALAAGLAFLPWAVLTVVATRFAPGLTTRYGVRAVIVVSLVLGAAGMVALAAAMLVGGSYASTLPGVAVLAAGQGLGFGSMFLPATQGVRPEQQGVASAMASTTQQVGSAIGLAVLVAVAGATASPEAPTRGLAVAALAAAGVALAGTAVARAIPSPHRAGSERPAR